MTVALDASMLILLFDEDARAPVDRATGQQVSHCQERIGYFLSTFSKPRGARIIIPTPALAEFFVKTKSGKEPEYINQLQRIRGCHVVPFSIKAAVEFAEMQRSISNEHGRRRKADLDTRAKVKFDQQIVAIAKTEGASTIYSDDQGLGRFAARFGIHRIGIADLPLSPDAAQGHLPLEPPEPTPRTDPTDL